MDCPALQPWSDVDSSLTEHVSSTTQASRESMTPSAWLSSVDRGAKDSASGTAVTAATIPSNTSTAAFDQLPQADIVFTTVPALLDYLTAIADCNVDSVTIGGVSPTNFAAIDKAIESRGWKRRLFFLAVHKLAIITIPTGAHESLHAQLYQGVEHQISSMGLRFAWAVTAATRFPNLPPNSPLSRGEGDSGGKPVPERQQQGWPTIVVEAGFTQSLESLRTKMRFWFAASNHMVKVVILAKVSPNDHAQKRILIEQWQENPASVPPRPGATATRLLARSASTAATLQPDCIQNISIVWALPGINYDEASLQQRNDPRSYNVVRGPLSIDFSRLFLRQPGAGEHDVVLQDQELQWYASIVWSA